MGDGRCLLRLQTEVEIFLEDASVSMLPKRAVSLRPSVLMLMLVVVLAFPLLPSHPPFAHRYSSTSVQLLIPLHRPKPRPIPWSCPHRHCYLWYLALARMKSAKRGGRSTHPISGWRL